MNPSSWRACAKVIAASFVTCISAAASDAEAPVPTDFSWRATLVLPAATSLARVEVPVQALWHMQSSAAHDVRVFNAAGAVVPFALLARADLTQPPPVAYTPAYTAHPLFASDGSAKAVPGGVEVRVDSAGANTSAWVRLGGDAAAAATAAQPPTALQSVLFDMRKEDQVLSALVLTAELPRNALVPVTVSTSSDLKTWSTVDTKGPLYHFDGADAPSSKTLELRQPLHVKGHYVRITWTGQAVVSVHTLVGRVSAAQTSPEPLRSALPVALADGKGALSWALPFATPVTALHLQAVHDNTLLPVRILGRTDATQPWRSLATSVVYRLDSVGTANRNPPTPLPPVSVRALRVEASQGAILEPDGVQATVEFAPLQIAFLASGAGPYTLAVGRAQTQPAAVDAALMGSVSRDRLATLPLATLANVVTRPPTALEGALPAGVDLRSVALWLVLGLGVAVLGAVAYSLLRQISAKR